MNGKRSIGRLGRVPYLSIEEEREIADWSVEMAKRGMGKTRREIFLTVKQILDLSGRKSDFVNNYPSKDWGTDFWKGMNMSR